MQKPNKFYENVYSLTRKIPRGKVTTYGSIAKMLLYKDSRRIGWALHANKDINTPCHRVITKDGRLAPNFAFDGSREQRRLLKSEGITFKDDLHVDHVDLDRHLYTFPQK